MTVLSVASKIVVAGNGATVDFTYNFEIPASGDEVILFTDALGATVTLSPSTYTVTGFGNPAGGSIHYPNVGSPIAAGTTLTIARILPLTQEISFSNQSAVYLGVTESTFDNTVRQIQQVAEAQSRNLVAPITDPAAPLPIPSAVQRAGLLLGFDSSGNPIALSTAPAGTISAAMVPVVNAATLAAGRTAFGLGSSSDVTFDQITVGPGALFMNAAGDLTMIGNLIVEGFTTAEKLVVVSPGTSTANADWVLLSPTDFGIGHPYLYIKKRLAATDYEIGLFDGATSAGTINFAQTGLTHQSNAIFDAGNIATQAIMETATSVVNPVVPGHQQSHPGHPKFWAFVSVSGGVPSLTSSWNVSSITDSGIGELGVTLTTPFSSASWCSGGTCTVNIGTDAICHTVSGKTASFVQYLSASGGSKDPIAYSVWGFGDQ